ncbi:hypothetical protein ILUMI_11626 [Ignelater luminosus]|uniref:Uncharacterized protein n=1 Tax=Ignelater luminosus TaxID=2038154 RepID=A0A8K0D1T2_IGNLU|nr:hypothetical protein ILUMI_11626 [Ignelater luminosus]
MYLLVVLAIFTFILAFVILKIYLKLTIGKCYCNVYLNGKVALITGGNSGLGFHLALALAGRGCRVIIADKDDCEKTKENIIAQTGNSNIVTKKFNLASLRSVRELVKDITDSEDRLDFLINNAGIGGTGKSYTEDGLDLGMQVNFFGHFLLTHLLIGLLKKSSPSKIIFLSSKLAFFHNLSLDNLNYPQDQVGVVSAYLKIYANSKLCSIIAARELSKKLTGTEVTVYAVHPGVVYTQIYLRNGKVPSLTNTIYKLFNTIMTKPLSRSPEEGIQTALHVILCKQIVKDTGKLFAECKVHRPPAKAEDSDFAKKIWNASENYVRLNPNEII